VLGKVLCSKQHMYSTMYNTADDVYDGLCSAPRPVVAELFDALHLERSVRAGSRLMHVHMPHRT
jgi:hypothetical protein